MRRARYCRPMLAALMTLSLGTTLGAAEALRSGPQPGQRTLPFTSTMVTGQFRGKQHCYVCELKDEPAVLVFVRRSDAATGRLLRELQEKVRSHARERLFAWMVFLPETGSSTPETELESRAFALARGNRATGLPVSALGDAQGPPGYRIAPDAAATVLFFQGGKVLHNRAFRASEWNDVAVESVLADLPKLLNRERSEP